MNIPFQPSQPFFKSLAFFPKHADDVVIDQPCRDPQGICIIYIALIYFSEGSGDDGLILSPNKCIHCIVSPQGNDDTDPNFSTYINGYALSATESVTYIAFSRLLTCVVPIILSCSPAIFQEILKHDFALLKRLIELMYVV